MSRRSKSDEGLAWVYILQWMRSSVSIYYWQCSRSSQGRDMIRWLQLPLSSWSD